jgi:hypothetical protein
MAFYSIPASAFGFCKQNLRAFVRWEFAASVRNRLSQTSRCLTARASCHLDA